MSLFFRTLLTQCCPRHRERLPLLFTSITRLEEYASSTCAKSSSHSRRFMTSYHRFLQTSPNWMQVQSIMEGCRLLSRICVKCISSRSLWNILVMCGKEITLVTFQHWQHWHIEYCYASLNLCKIIQHYFISYLYFQTPSANWKNFLLHL